MEILHFGIKVENPNKYKGVNIKTTKLLYKE